MKKSIKLMMACALCFSLWGGKSAKAQNVVDTFFYTGATQTFTIPPCVDSVTIDCYGAEGIAVANEFFPGYGGEAKGTLVAAPGTTLSIYVGGQAGWNGGGLGQNGANGGDASDVRMGGLTLADRIIVAGGGGGSGGDNWQCTGGVYANGGGGTTIGTNFVGGGGGEGYTSGSGCGGDGATNGGSGGGGGCHGGGGGGGGFTSGGAGATATCGPFTADSGSIGQGGAAYAAPGCGGEGAGGGGGGYYGGGGAVGFSCGAGQGGGGSSWTGTLHAPFFNYGTWTGNGEIIIRWTQPDTMTNLSGNVIKNVSCNGGSDAKASGTVTGGTAPFTYSWAPSGGTGDTAKNLSAGTYTVTVNSCAKTLTASVTITQPAALNVVRNSKANTGGCNGAAWVTVTGGSTPYNYSWTGGNTTDSIGGQCTGSYCCTVIDANGCTDSVCITVTGPAGLADIVNPNGVSIYPDPNAGYFTVSGVKAGQVIEVYNYMGQNISKTVVDNTSMQFNISNMPGGIYMVRIQNTDGSFVTEKKVMKVQ